MSTRPIMITSLLAAVLLAGCGGPGRRGLQNRAEARQRLNIVNAELAHDQAMQAFKGGQFEKALKEIRTAIILYPGWADYRLLQGRIFLEIHRLAKSMESFESALELQPRHAEVHYYAGIVYQRWSDDEKAYESYRRAVELEPDSVHYLLAAAESLVALDKFTAATHLIESKLAYFEHNAAMRHLLGQIALLQGDAVTAAELYEEAWRLMPEDEVMLDELVQAQFGAEQYGKCLRSVKTLQDMIEKERTDLLHMEALCLAFLDRQTEARNLYLKLTQIDPMNTDFWIELGTLAWEIGDFHRMALCGARVTALAPQRYEGFMLKGVNERHHGNLEDAAMFLRQSAQRAESTALPHLVLGRVLEQMGDTQAALEAYAEAVRIAPDNADAQALYIDSLDRLLTVQHPNRVQNE